MEVTELVRRTYGASLNLRDDMGMLNDTGDTTDDALAIVAQIDPGVKRVCVCYLGNSVVTISKRGA
jgi:hypothetical protein